MGKGAKKNKKDKDAPKKAISAYFFYIKERRESITKEQPSLNNKEIVKKMSEEWNALSDEKKKPYVQKAEADKKRYENEKEQPKKPISAYFFYVKERRDSIIKELPNLNNKEIIKK